MKPSKRFFAMTLAILAAAGTTVRALIMVGNGNTPVTDPGWPVNAATLANATNRVGWWEGPPFGGGEWHFEYRGDTLQLQKALDVLATVGSNGCDVFVQDGAAISFATDPNRSQGTNQIDWTFTVWDPARWTALYGDGKKFGFSDDPNFGRSMPAPRLDVFPESTRSIEWNKIRLPAHLSLHDERASTAGVDTRNGTVFAASIVDVAQSKPIRGARLVVTGRDEQNRYTRVITNVFADATGWAQVSGLPPGIFQVSAAADGYVEESLGTGDFGAHSYKKFEAHLSKSTQVAGALLDETGNGVGGIRVVAANTLLSAQVPYRSLHKPETISDGHGHFVLTNLPSGLVQVWTYSTGHFSTNLFDYFRTGETNLVIAMFRSGKLIVNIRDAAGKPVYQHDKQTLQVSVNSAGGAVLGSWGGSMNVDTNGAAVFEGIHPGDYFVGVSSVEKQPVSIKPGQTAELTIQVP